jgi:hypothetical protein
LEEEKMAAGLGKMLKGQAGKWSGDSALRQTFEETQGWWLELLMNRYRQGKKFEEVWRTEDDAGLAAVLQSSEVFLIREMGVELYALYPEKPTPRWAARWIYFYQQVRSSGIVVPEETAKTSH